MNYQELYRSKLGSLEGALELIRSGDTIATPIYGNEPAQFLKQLHTIAPRVEGVALWTMLMMGDYPVMLDNSLKGQIDIYTFFYNKDCRAGHQTGRFHMVPLNLHAVGETVIQTRRPNIYVAAVSPMDRHGNVYLSFDLEAARECLEAADTVIFEVNHHLPRVFGETAVPIARADYIYEADTPLPSAPAAPSTEVERQIAANVVSLIQDGDCIQLGIGGMPNAVGEALMDKQDLGIHTEMITSSMGKLLTAGVVTNRRKNFCPGKTIGAFAWGDQNLYDYMAENPAVELRRAAWVNDPFNIAQNDNMVSVNAAIQVDLTGQICSESMGPRQFSGTGGASDFAYGAFHSKGGRGIIALTSTAKGGTVSKIQPQLTPGAVVSISRNLTGYVVTEYGIAKLKNRTVRQRVENLIAIAHPDFRAELRKQADQLMLW
ncbi:MAG: 4-hydroxybutyrate--acetyl-CoA CoA transferase [Oscillospiraceae bacterium]|nr:4-hydroxybutyrate--acetyl-CoA CoA transferase [Oscillospiraceae bacterium]